MKLAEQIEQHLLTRGAWVPSDEICALFAVTDRQLRQVNDSPGLCSAFAISSQKGFKHVAKATTREWLHFKHRLRKHGISELVRVRNLGRARSAHTRNTKRPPPTYELDSPQSLMILREGTA